MKIKFVILTVVLLISALLLSIFGIRYIVNRKIEKEKLDNLKQEYNENISYIGLDYNIKDDDIIVDDLEKLDKIPGIMTSVEETKKYYLENNIKPGEIYDGVPAIDVGLVNDEQWDTKARLLGLRRIHDESASIEYGGAGLFFGLYANEDGFIYLAMKFINIENTLLFPISKKPLTDKYDVNAQLYMEMGVNDKGEQVHIERSNDIHSLADVYINPDMYKSVLIPNSAMYIGVTRDGVANLTVRMIKV